MVVLIDGRMLEVPRKYSVLLDTSVQARLEGFPAAVDIIAGWDLYQRKDASGRTHVNQILPIKILLYLVFC